jgi:hypothetical protein
MFVEFHHADSKQVRVRNSTSRTIGKTLGPRPKNYLLRFVTAAPAYLIFVQSGMDSSLKRVLRAARQGSHEQAYLN